MIYSGMDLIRRAENQVERAEKLTRPRVVAVESAGTDQNSDPGEETRDALLRFAKFIHGNAKENTGRHKPRPRPNLVPKRGGEKAVHPYKMLSEREASLTDLGQLIDIYA